VVPPPRQKVRKVFEGIVLDLDFGLDSAMSSEMAYRWPFDFEGMLCQVLVG
jgi:hypothetical protein